MSWYRFVVMWPMLLTCFVALACRLAMPELTCRFTQLAYIAASGLVTLLATFVATKQLRIIVLQRLNEQLRFAKPYPRYRRVRRESEVAKETTKAFRVFLRVLCLSATSAVNAFTSLPATPLPDQPATPDAQESTPPLQLFRRATPRRPCTSLDHSARDRTASSAAPASP